MVGHEGANSLLSELIRQDLASSLSCGDRQRCQGNYSGFKITVTLTEKGVAQKEEVVRLIFAFISKMRRSGEPPKYIEDERRVMSDINF